MNIVFVTLFSATNNAMVFYLILTIIVAVTLSVNDDCFIDLYFFSVQQQTFRHLCFIAIEL